jgi:hypothetical protein
LARKKRGRRKERWFRGGEKRAWWHAMVCMPMWHDLEEMGQRQKNGGKKR